MLIYINDKCYNFTLNISKIGVYTLPTKIQSLELQKSFKVQEIEVKQK